MKEPKKGTSEVVKNYLIKKITENFDVEENNFYEHDFNEFFDPTPERLNRHTLMVVARECFSAKCNSKDYRDGMDKYTYIIRCHATGRSTSQLLPSMSIANYIDYLQGLPTLVPIAWENHEIFRLMVEWGYAKEERGEDWEYVYKICEKYWNLVGSNLSIVCSRAVNGYTVKPWF